MKQAPDQKASFTFFSIFIAAITAIHFLIPRHASLTLGIVYFILFFSYFWISQVDRPPWKVILVIGLLARLLLLLSTPSLSDDFYRFIWDGSLSAFADISPYAYIPGEIYDQGLFDGQKELFLKLNSPNYYSVYLPLHQILFRISVIFSDQINGQLAIIRMVFIFTDVAAFFFIRHLLPNKKIHFLSWMFLNPLWILEGVGNLHIEGLLICLILGIIFFLQINKSKYASLWLGMAIGIKLLPAIFLPAIAWKYRWKKGAIISILSMAVAFILVAPVFYESQYLHLLESLNLYQRTFEFNASFYYLLREIGFWYKGYNIIATLGPALSKTAGVLIVLLAFWGAWKKRPLVEILLFSWTVYLLLSTTIHPWYMLPLLPLGLLSGFFYPVAWTLLVFFSYFGYNSTGYQVPYYWIFIEYLALFAFITYETIKNFSSHTDTKFTTQ